LAELSELHGSAERDFASKPEAWDKAVVGEAFRAGDALRTGGASDAYVRLTRGGALKLGPSSLVRFRGAAGGSRHVLGIEAGEAEIESGGEAMSFDTRLGEARIEAGGRLKVSTAGDRTRFEVIVGQTILEGDASPTRLGQGDEISLDIGGAVIERTTPGVPDTASSAAAPGATLGLTVTASVRGNGAQVQKDGEHGFVSLPQGEAQISPGSRVRLAGGTSLSVDRGGERASVRGAGEVMVGAPGGALLDAMDGEVMLDGSSNAARIDVPGGSIVARQGGRAGVLVRRGKPTDVTAEQGEVEVHGKNGRVILTPGQSTSLGRGGELESENATPTRVDFSITAGESPIVHDPGAPTAVRVQFPGLCTGLAEVEVAAGRKKGARARGAGSAAVMAAPGTNRYRVRCVEDNGVSDVRAQGVILVAKDSGTARLPLRAPHNAIDADGRRYTVLYQNLLPQLTVNWPSAPAGKTLVLHVEPEHGATRAINTNMASVQFSSGQFAEGTYSFWFEIPDDRHRSPKTTLRVDFDNAAPAAQIQEPTPGEPISGVVKVAGIAMEGASVSVSGVDLPLDAQYRFRDEASARPGEASLAIRIAHPKHGIHYYLRRVQKAEQ
jgi:ferric-dicitrate binding protein FerR (iron transport regulator)